MSTPRTHGAPNSSPRDYRGSANSSNGRHSSARALLMFYFALYANAVHHFVLVSDWAAGWLRWLYGDAAERLRPF
jgi:hypothetical protein